LFSTAQGASKRLRKEKRLSRFHIRAVKFGMLIAFVPLNGKAIVIELKSLLRVMNLGR
jgi:hypothetical protein